MRSSSSRRWTSWASGSASSPRALTWSRRATPRVASRVRASVRPERGARGHLRRLLWTQTGLRRLVRRVAATPAPEHDAGRAGAPSVPQVTVMHDLLPLLYPEEYPRQQHYFRRFVPAVLRHSRAVIVISESTRRDLAPVLSGHRSRPGARRALGVRRATVFSGAARGLPPRRRPTRCTSATSCPTRTCTVWWTRSPSPRGRSPGRLVIRGVGPGPPRAGTPRAHRRPRALAARRVGSLRRAPRSWRGSTGRPRCCCCRRSTRVLVSPRSRPWPAGLR